MEQPDRDDLMQRLEALTALGLTRRDILRLTAGVVSSSALAGVLAACGEGQSAKTTTSSNVEPSKDVEIEYWQYTFKSKVELVDKLIPSFQALHPKIKVKHVHYPYDAFRQKVQAAVQAGTGPDVINVFYGWVPAYYQANFLKPLPEQVFPADKIQQEFFPMVSSVKFDGKYYALPTAVRTLGLFWNKDLLAKAGFTKAPATWEETVEVAVKTTKRAADGKLEQAGMTWDPGGQGHSWWRSCLTRQNGAKPLTADNKKVLWTDPGAVEAFIWYLDLNRKHKTGVQGFYTDGSTAFQTGHAALHIDGSYRVGTLVSNAPTLNFGVAPLPKHKAPASYASFWCNAVTRLAKGDREIAAGRFIDYLASPAVMRQWTPAIGELPARAQIAKEAQFTQDAKLAAFIDQLGYSYADFLVDESLTRQAAMDAIDKVLLKNADPKQALTEAREIVQKSTDEYWAQVKK